MNKFILEQNGGDRFGGRWWSLVVVGELFVLLGRVEKCWRSISAEDGEILAENERECGEKNGRNLR